MHNSVILPFPNTTVTQILAMDHEPLGSTNFPSYKKKLQQRKKVRFRL